MIYEYCHFPFDEWNRMQERCVPWFTEDRNIVVSASMASGKTAVAEAVMGYELHNGPGKCVYVSPLRSLGAERHAAWKEHVTFSDCLPLLMDGEHHHEPSEYSASRLIVSTIESMDMACRSREGWVGSVAVLVADEAHFLADPRRGHSLEALLMRFSSMVPSARLILLSGTLSNAREIASWVKSLNGKPTSFIQSSWRPTELFKRVEEADGFGRTLEKAVCEIKAGEGGKTLVFVHSKKLGEELCKRLKKAGVRCAFFTSDMDEAARSSSLALFKASMSGLDVLVSTSSLAMGVNV
ncbi:MAG: DEAD/DEAH box helicase [Clostridia bacterium]|nr:DEAD/DEAH box helicase [Clostridia bacterium]